MSIERHRRENGDEVDYREQNEKRDAPNIIERLENLLAALGEASTTLTDNQGWDPNVLQRIEDAEGIAGEILTMIDGR